MEAIEAFSQVPEDHLGILIGFTAVCGGLFVGLILGGISIWRGITLQGKLAEIRAEMIAEMLRAGLSSSEILAVLDHPSMSTQTNAQRRQTHQIVETIVGRTPIPQKPAKMPA